MLIGGIQRERHIDRRNPRQRQPPERCHAIETQDRLESEGHHQPRGDPEDLRPAAGEDREQDRGEIGDGQAQHGARQQERRVAQLRIGGARDHAADVLDHRIAANAPHAIGQSDPDRTMGFEPFRQRAIVDQGAADRSHAAGFPEYFPAHQHAAAGCRGGGPTWIIGPGERVEHLEKENECRDEHALGETLTAKLRHQRGQDITARSRPGRKFRERVRRVDDVGVGEEEIDRRMRRGLGCLDTLALRPELSGPSRRQGPAGQDGKAVGGAQRQRRCARDLRRTVAALVVDQDHGKFARIILPQQRRHRFANAFGLIARRNHGHDRRPRSLFRSLPQRNRVIAFPAEPERSAPEKEIEPNRQHH